MQPIGAHPNALPTAATRVTYWCNAVHLEALVLPAAHASDRLLFVLPGNPGGTDASPDEVLFF